MPSTSHFIEVHGSKMHYTEEGAGNPILFLHGMPTSSFLWRNIIPVVSSLGRCIAVDLIGMGKSDKPDIDYSFSDHVRYIEKFIEALNLKNLIIVMHGWGSVIGFDYAMRHENNCRGLVFYESYLQPLIGKDISLPLQEQILSINHKNDDTDIATVVNTMMKQGVMESISEDIMNHYTAPFSQKNAEKVLHQYAKELSQKTQLNNFISSYSKKLMHSKLPKLMLYSVPGFITPMSTVIWAKENLSHIEIIDIGEELHFAQESNPTLMGEAMSVWLQSIEQLKKGDK
ncbi:MAG: haloalkane dehalogenase [Gammaproteobacteria bacterium]|nr:haloalkane dehalogenase [Gammaproteobacteria bacterium]